MWLPYDDAPGLEMARDFGYFCLKEYGVIAIPEVSYRLLTERDQFVVLASDGVSPLYRNMHVYTFCDCHRIDTIILYVEFH